MWIFDAHLDLAMNAVEYNRDLTQPLEDVKSRELNMQDKVDRGKGVCTFPEMRRAKIGICIATQIARYVAPGNPLPGWHSPEIAWSITQAQLAWYRTMEEAGHLVQIIDAEGLNRHVQLWEGDPPGRRAHWLYPKPGGRRLHSFSSASRARIRARLAGDWPRPLRRRTLLSRNGGRTAD